MDAFRSGLHYNMSLVSADSGESLMFDSDDPRGYGGDVVLAWTADPADGRSPRVRGATGSWLCSREAAPVILGQLAPWLTPAPG